MTIVEISGWSPGFQKVQCTRTLQLTAGLSLSEAKRTTDGVLEGITQSINMPSTEEAEQLVLCLQALGAIAHYR